MPLLFTQKTTVTDHIMVDAIGGSNLEQKVIDIKNNFIEIDGKFYFDSPWNYLSSDSMRAVADHLDDLNAPGEHASTKCDCCD